MTDIFPKCDKIQLKRLRFVKHRITYLCCNCGLVICENRGLELVTILNKAFRDKIGGKKK